MGRHSSLGFFPRDTSLSFETRGFNGPWGLLIRVVMLSLDQGDVLEPSLAEPMTRSHPDNLGSGKGPCVYNINTERKELSLWPEDIDIQIFLARFHLPCFFEGWGGGGVSRQGFPV